MAVDEKKSRQFPPRAQDDSRFFRAAMDASPHGIILRAEGAVVYENAAWDSITIPGIMKKKGKRAPMAVEHSRFEFEFDGTPVEAIVARETSRGEADSELRDVQKLEVLGRWVGGVVHDFNNLLTAVMLYSDLLEQTLPAGGVQSAYNDEIRNAAKRGADLTGQLLGFARQRTPEPVLISLNALIHGMSDVLRRMIGEHLELVFDLAEAPCNVMINPSQMEQVLFNLALNSRDAMPGGGKITVQTREVQVSEPGRAQVSLIVSDTGTGMDNGTLSHIFEPFFTTKPGGKGTGLGLSTVQSIVTQNGGTISVDSQVGLGTTVKVLLPRVDLAHAKESTEPPDAQLPVGDETVLVAEDDSAVRTSIGTLLEQCGYTVLMAENGPEAVRIASQFPGRVDLLIADLVLPGYSGREVARRLKAARSLTSVLFISGHDQSNEDHSGEDTTVLAKPFHKHALAARVRQSLDSGAPAAKRAQ
jgi:signal transduction histidine kinase